jgi:hypothetical protein
VNPPVEKRDPLNPAGEPSPVTPSSSCSLPGAGGAARLEHSRESPGARLSLGPYRYSVTSLSDTSESEAAVLGGDHWYPVSGT